MPRRICWLLCTLAVPLFGCAVADRPAPGGADLAQVARCYDRLDAPARRAVRKPIRDAQGRTLRALAEITARHRDGLPAAGTDEHAVRYRGALDDLHTAALARDLSAVRHAYAEVIAADCAPRP
jgi:hypothetical protein